MKFSFNVSKFNIGKIKKQTQRSSKYASKVKKEVNKKLAKKKKLRVLVIKHDNNESTFSMNFLITVPVKDISINISRLYSKYAYDYKKVAEDENKTWYIGISGPKTYASSHEELVVPDEYAKMYVEAQKNISSEWMLIIVPYIKDTVFGIAKDGNIIYSVKKDISMITSSPNKISVLIDNILREIGNLLPISISQTAIVDPPQPISNEILNTLQGLSLNPFVDNDVDPLMYNDVLTLNSKYAYHTQMTPTSMLSSLSNSIKNIIVLSLLFFVSFSWVYFPTSAVVSNIDHAYKVAIKKVMADTTKIVQNKAIFQQAINNLKQKEEQIDNYKKETASIGKIDFVPILKTITSNNNGTIRTINYAGGTFTITAVFPNASYLDKYIQQLLISGYFASIVPTSRTNAVSTYTITATLAKPNSNQQQNNQTNNNGG